MASRVLQNPILCRKASTHLLNTGSFSSILAAEKSAESSGGFRNRKCPKMSSTWSPTLTLENMNPCIKQMEYAVRGPLVIRATEIEKELESGVKKPFNSVIKANIGDAHAMGNVPVTFLRQILALVSYPELLNSNEFPEDAKSRAQVILEGCKNGSAGSYSDSPGIEIIRRHVAEYIEQRDGGIKSDWQNIILCAGASEGIRAVMKCLTNPNAAPDAKKPGVMIPIPQYPLYSASLAEYNMHQIGYYLDEDKNWSLDMDVLEKAYQDATEVCNPRAIVIINPGNPTGNVLSRANIEAVVKFAAQKNYLYLPMKYIKTMFMLMDVNFTLSKRL